MEVLFDAENSSTIFDNTEESLVACTAVGVRVSVAKKVVVDVGM